MYTIGDKKTYKKLVLPEDVASFHGKMVHEVYATFALARDMEWVSRLFVLDIKNEDEEGIGTELHIKHINPALVGDELTFEAVISSITNHSLYCDVTVKSTDKLIATGITGQKILKLDRLKNLFLNHKK